MLNIYFFSPLDATAQLFDDKDRENVVTYSLLLHFAFKINIQSFVQGKGTLFRNIQYMYRYVTLGIRSGSYVLVGSYFLIRPPPFTFFLLPHFKILYLWDNIQIFILFFFHFNSLKFKMKLRYCLIWLLTFLSLTTKIS